MTEKEFKKAYAEKALKSIIETVEKKEVPEKFKSAAIENLQKCNACMEFLQRDLKQIERKISNTNDTNQLVIHLVDLMTTAQFLKAINVALNRSPKMS